MSNVVDMQAATGLVEGLGALTGRARGAVAVTRVREAMRQWRPEGGSLVVLFVRPTHSPAYVMVKVLDADGKQISAPGYVQGCRYATDVVTAEGIDPRVVADLVALERMDAESGRIAF